MTTDNDIAMANFEEFAANFRRERAAEKREILGFPPVLVATVAPVTATEADQAEARRIFVEKIAAATPALVQTGDATWTEVHNLYAGELVSARPGEPVEYDDESLAQVELDRAEDAHFETRMGW